MSSNSEPKGVDYDDELDEKFEDDLAKKSTEKELGETIKSFDDPKGLEEKEDSPLKDVNIDRGELEKMLQKIKKMPKNQLQQFLNNFVEKNDCGLGKCDFAHVSSDHREDARSRLRQKLKQKQMQRKTQYGKSVEAAKEEERKKEDEKPSDENENHDVVKEDK
jgi:hypothetical protein